MKTILLISALSAATALAQPFGICFGPFTGNQDPATGVVLPESQLRGRLTPLRGKFRWVRSYGSTHGLQLVGRLAKSMGFKTAISAWIGPEDTPEGIAANQAEIASLIAAANAGHVDIAIVGNEVLLRGDLSEERLLEIIAEVRAAIPWWVPVTTAETHDNLLAHSAVMAACDVICAHFHPYWQGIRIDEAVSWLDDEYQALRLAAGGKWCVIGEAGWPSEGDPEQLAEPGLENAAYFWSAFQSWAVRRNIPNFYFSAFDEAFKEALEPNRVGKNWGIHTAKGVLKPGFKNVFDDKLLPEAAVLRAAVEPPALPPPPSVALTAIPAHGVKAQKTLCGVVSDLGKTAANRRLACYIEVDGLYWTKPFFNKPLFPVLPDGAFTTKIVTGGVDQNASEIALFLVPSDYKAPLAAGVPFIPGSIEQDALASAFVSRPEGSPAGGDGEPGFTASASVVRKLIAGSASESASLKGIVVLPADFEAAGVVVGISLCGLEWSFNPLGKSGSSVAADASAEKAVGSLSLKRDAKYGFWRWSAALKRSASASLDAYGMINATISTGSPVFLPLALDLDGQAFETVCRLHYTAAQNGTGTAK
ncbi:MAG TPA: hypothetical protein DIT64_21570 [Verrucomicrobiales bacterium]|nr:hypothetical protein [Verrucomicrobiales bacterium]